MNLKTDHGLFTILNIDVQVFSKILRTLFIIGGYIKPHRYSRSIAFENWNDYILWAQIAHWRVLIETESISVSGLLLSCRLRGVCFLLMPSIIIRNISC